MKFLRKLPNSVRYPPGLEWAVLKKLPLVVLLGTLLPLVIAQTNRVFPPDAAAAQVAKHIKFVDILCIATAVTAWTAVLTVAIGCVVVVVMKGPAYVADAYRVEDAERPRLRR